MSEYFVFDGGKVEPTGVAAAPWLTPTEAEPSGGAATAESARELRDQLAAASSRLATKTELASAALRRLRAKKAEAAAREAEAAALRREFEEHDAATNAKRGAAGAELAQAEAALLSARASVRAIKKTQLDEVRQLARPPAGVQKTMTTVAVMIGRADPANAKSLDWGYVRKVLRADDFLSTVVAFRPEDLAEKARGHVRKGYLADAEVDAESVHRSSKACGPLYTWIESQCENAEIARRVRPLRDEVATLQAARDALAAKKDAAEAARRELEASVGRCEAEYKAAIAETDGTKKEAEALRAKLARAEALLGELEPEAAEARAPASSVLPASDAALLAELLAELNVEFSAERLACAEAFFEREGADSLADVVTYDCAELFVEDLALPRIKARKLVERLARRAALTTPTKRASGVSPATAESSPRPSKYWSSRPMAKADALSPRESQAVARHKRRLEASRPQARVSAIRSPLAARARCAEEYSAAELHALLAIPRAMYAHGEAGLPQNYGLWRGAASEYVRSPG